jgi:hypothetical protein
MKAKQKDEVEFANWLFEEVISGARGDRFTEMPVAPAGKLWLGRIAPETYVRNHRLGERAERLEPCEIGMRLLPAEWDSRRILCRARAAVWKKSSDELWSKSQYIEVPVEFEMPTPSEERRAFGREDFERAFSSIGADGLSAEIHAEVERSAREPNLAISFVNTSPEEMEGMETTLYEAELEVNIGPIRPFVLDAIKESFRYKRKIPAYGINGGVERLSETAFVTTDYVAADQSRQKYWDEETGDLPDFTFDRMSRDPLPELRSLVVSLRKWGKQNWSQKQMGILAVEDDWSPEMLNLAVDEGKKFEAEVSRIDNGIRILESEERILEAFKLMNRAFLAAPAIKHDRWRPFQVGFILSCLGLFLPGERSNECRYVDILWFQTGGGKTETYLGILVLAAFYDRLMGKLEGVTAWARFPLRMLSLQQVQRFADVFCAAELVREAKELPGDPFSLGFFVGPGTPNGIRRDPHTGEPDPADIDIDNLGRYQIIVNCPFCGSDSVSVRFNRDQWTLEHYCSATGCPREGRAYPVYIVDQEIFRFLPTAVIGTLDKAAIISMQAAMRGLYGAPEGKCSVSGHGFTYSPRSQRANGCLFPGCDKGIHQLEQSSELFPPRLRLQDELHLLRDSLGAIDAHYELLLDHLIRHWGSESKVLASSATLAGHDNQVAVLYRRQGRVFPLQGPKISASFWSCDTNDLARKFVGLAPRGVTIEYATDQLIESLQNGIRRATKEKETVASEAGVDEQSIHDLISLYGTDVAYGSTLRDVEAVARSFESQMKLANVNAVTLTGKTPLQEVREALKRLKEPEAEFDNRIHLVAASSMLSHGVDIDRLNIMVMLGLPLSTAEFIQTTSRVGRKYPGLIFVLHKMGRERDAGVFRTFRTFIQHADRMIDPIPITGRSRRVLDLTFPGILMGRIYGIHEPESLRSGYGQLTTVNRLKDAFTKMGIQPGSELEAIIDLLDVRGVLNEKLRNDLERMIGNFFRELYNPATRAKYPQDLFSNMGPMKSLRDVEEQVPVYSRGGR